MTGVRCEYCGLPANGPMLDLAPDAAPRDQRLAHANCVIRRLNMLLDPDWEPGREPSRIIGLVG